MDFFRAIVVFCLALVFLSQSAISTAGDLVVISKIARRGAVHLGNCMAERELKSRMLSAVNEARAQSRRCGYRFCQKVRPLRWNSRLAQAALIHSNDMAKHGLFSHEGSDNSLMLDRVQKTGYQPRVLGENLAKGQKDVDEAVESWIKSPHHCLNLMFPDFQEMGASCVMDQRGKRYWTLILAAPF